MLPLLVVLTVDAQIKGKLKSPVSREEMSLEQILDPVRMVSLAPDEARSRQRQPAQFKRSFMRDRLHLASQDRKYDVGKDVDAARRSNSLPNHSSRAKEAMVKDLSPSKSLAEPAKMSQQAMTDVQADGTDDDLGSDTDSTIELPARFDEDGQPTHGGGWKEEGGVSGVLGGGYSSIKIGFRNRRRRKGGMAGILGDFLLGDDDLLYERGERRRSWAGW